MLKLKPTRDHQAILSTLCIALSSFQFVQAVDTNSTTSASASTSSCTPLNCVAVCKPECSNEEACVLRTMTNCAVCPASQCFNRASIGLPPKASGNTTNQPSSSDNSNNSGLIGGVVGGLVGLGIIIGIGVFCYIKRGKKKRKLPFAFTDGGIVSQEKFHQQNPSLIATLAQHNRSVVSSSEPNNNSNANNSRYIGLTELPLTSPTSTINNNNNNNNNNNRSIINNNPNSSQLLTSNNTKNPSTISSIQHDTTVYNSHSNLNNENNYAIPTSNSTPNTISNITTSAIADHILASPTSTIGNGITPPVIPEEFEERIALQNKRISQILSNNPRLSRGSYIQQPSQTIAENRMSGISYTTDDDSEFDDDDRSISSSTTPQQAVVQSRSPYQPQSASQAVQVTRAKAQIMRVNSVRTVNNGTTGNGGGLGRSDSVRTILTSVGPPVLSHQESAENSSLADSFPSTPNNRSFTIEDPFLDTAINNHAKQ